MTKHDIVPDELCGSGDQPVSMLKRWVRCTITCLTFSVLIAGCKGESDRTSAPETMRVMAYNIHHGEGMDNVIDLQRIADLILEADPDVVTLQEVDSVTQRTGGIDQAAELGRLTGYDFAFSEFMPYQGGGYGMAVLSRWPIVGVHDLRLPDGEEPRTALSVKVESPVSGRHIRIVGIHFYMTEEERLAQAKATEEQLGQEDFPAILAGDFNSRPESEVMSHLGKSWHIVRKPEADHFTFPSFAPDHEIDYVLIRPEAQFEVVNQYLINEPVISDHRPYVVDLAWK